MTLLQFVKSKLDQDTPEGDLARDLYSNKEFRAHRTDELRRVHIEVNTGGIAEVAERFFGEFDEINSK